MTTFKAVDPDREDPFANMKPSRPSFEQTVAYDRFRLMVSLAWAVGAMEVQGIDAGMARAVLDDHLNLANPNDQTHD